MRSGNARFHDSLTDLLVPIDRVEPHPSNPRNGDIDLIAESIEVNGFVAPVIAQKSTGHIIAGNHRYYALLQMQSEVIPVVWLDIDDLAAKRYLVADNRTSDRSTYDYAELTKLLIEIGGSELQLAGTGFSHHDLEVIQHLSAIPVEHEHGFAQWPTLQFQVHPRIAKAFREMTEEADTDAEAFELLLRLAGWEG